MSNMSYCRHENTARDLADVWDHWENFDEHRTTDYEKAGRRRIVQMVREMHEQFEDDGTYEELDS